MERQRCSECRKVTVIFNKKNMLCSRCYGAIYRSRKKDAERRKNGNVVSVPPRITEDALGRASEILFIQNFFSDNPRWIHEPATFKIRTGELYRPDFFDIDRQTFIEVSANRQAYHQNAEKYSIFRETYPCIAFEIRYVDGSLLDDGKFHIPSKQNENSE